jgi:Ca2+-binding RTX toxin-like protein
VLTGGNADDTLVGGAGVDFLHGGSGADAFRFDGPAGAADRDLLRDFDPGTDRIEVSAAGFGGGLAEGTDLGAAGRFALHGAVAGTEATFVYAQATGWLQWDTNGADPGGRSLIAILGGAPALGASDITVIA